MIGSEQAVQAGKVPCERPTAGPAPFSYSSGGGGGFRGFPHLGFFPHPIEGILSEASEGWRRGSSEALPGLHGQKGFHSCLFGVSLCRWPL